jgi:hypothetical protein
MESLVGSFNVINYDQQYERRNKYGQMYGMRRNKYGQINET